MNTDIRELENGERVILHPNADNPLHHRPVAAVYSDGYFYCEGTKPTDGPDYYFGDVLRWNQGWERAHD